MFLMVRAYNYHCTYTFQRYWSPRKPMKLPELRTVTSVKIFYSDFAIPHNTIPVYCALFLRSLENRIKRFSIHVNLMGRGNTELVY